MAEWWRQFAKNVKRDRALLIIVLPAVVHYLVFVYYPMFGNIIALGPGVQHHGVGAEPDLVRGLTGEAVNAVDLLVALYINVSGHNQFLLVKRAVSNKGRVVIHLGTIHILAGEEWNVNAGIYQNCTIKRY